MARLSALFWLSGAMKKKASLELRVLLAVICLASPMQDSLKGQQAELPQLSAEEKQLFASQVDSARTSVRQIRIRFQAIPLGPRWVADIDRSDVQALIDATDQGGVRRFESLTRSLLSPKLQEKFDTNGGRYRGGERETIFDGARFRETRFAADGRPSTTYVFDGADFIAREAQFKQVTIGERRKILTLGDFLPLVGAAGELASQMDSPLWKAGFAGPSSLIVDFGDSVSFGFHWPSCRLEQTVVRKSGSVATQKFFLGYETHENGLDFPNAIFELHFDEHAKLLGGEIRLVSKYELGATLTGSDVAVAGERGEVVVDHRAGVSPDAHLLYRPVTNIKLDRGGLSGLAPDTAAANSSVAFIIALNFLLAMLVVFLLFRRRKWRSNRSHPGQQ